MTTGWFAYNMMMNSIRHQEENERQIWEGHHVEGNNLYRDGEIIEDYTWQPMDYSPGASGAMPMELRPTASAIEKAANEVYRLLGTGHSEAVYEAALVIELGIQGFKDIRTQVPHPIHYKGRSIGTGYIDILIGNRYIIELKAIGKLTSKDEAQVRKYRTNTLQTCLLVNFNPAKEEVEVVDVYGVDDSEGRD